MQDNILTQKIARQFIAGKVKSLEPFTSIDDAAAESLSKHQGTLDLRGLRELSDAAAESLSKHQGYLDLSTKLKDQIAKFKSDASVPEVITGDVKVSVAISEDVAGTSGSDDVAIKNDAVEAVAVFETAEANEAKNSSENADDKISMEKATPAPSPEELEAKLDRLAEMIKGGYLELVAQLISVSTDAWLFEALLKGSSIDEEGTLKLGEGLERFAEDAQSVGFLVWAYAPAGAEIDSSFEDKNRPLKWEVRFTVKNLEPIVAWRAKHFPHFPQLEIVSLDDGTTLNLNGLTELSDAAAESLSKHQGNLWLTPKLKKQVAKAGYKAAKLKGTPKMKWDPDFLKGVKARWKKSLGIDGFTSAEQLLATLTSQGTSPKEIVACMEANDMCMGGDSACERAVKVGWLTGAWDVSWTTFQEAMESQSPDEMAQQAAELIADAVLGDNAK